MKEKISSSSRNIVGKIIGINSLNTLVVSVEKKVKHPIFKKYINRKRKFLIHNNGNELKIGDIVEFSSCKPISKKKYYIFNRIV
jgi:small subunit ribosomal protein S17